MDEAGYHSDKFVGDEPVSIAKSPVCHPCRTSLGDTGGGSAGRTGRMCRSELLVGGGERGAVKGLPRGQAL